MQSLNALLFVQRWEEAQRERLDRYKRAWQYYNGDHKMPLAVRQGQPDDNVLLNLARLVVDKGATFLFGKELKFELQEGETTPEEELLDQIWMVNHKMTFLGKLAMQGGIYGDIFVKIVPEEYPGGLPRLVSIEPEYVQAFYADEDIEEVYQYRIEWQTMELDSRGDMRGIERRQDIFRSEAGDSWEIRNYVIRGGGSWKADPDRPDVAWPREWSPIMHAQNLPLPGSYYGQSDIDDLREQDAINYVASKVNRILRYHAHPKTVGTGFSKTDLMVNEDEAIILPNPEAQLRNLEMQSDLSSSLTFLDKLTAWFMAGTRTPRLDPATVNVGALSGFALKILYGDALEKANVKRRTYGDMLIELNRRLLDMMGHGPENYTTLHWPDPLPEDHAAEKERDGFELDYGLVSKETVQSRRNINHDVEEQRMAADEVHSGNVGALMLRAFERGGGANNQ